jgi:hypothetical protein
MIADVIPIVRELVPGLLTCKRPSVACVRTTNEKYLVFNGDPDRPACVVEFGDEARLRRLDRILGLLHAKCPGLVPRPLACSAWAPGTVVHIEEGMSGQPWFRLHETLPSTAAWQSLLERAVAAMHRLHDAIGSVPGWSGSLDLGQVLGDQVEVWLAEDGSPSAPVVRNIRRWVDELSGFPPMIAVSQHGDFSLNNLMVGRDSISIIDFEEFAVTSVPLHDAFGLALSFPMSQNGRCPITLRECIEVCIGGPSVVRSYDPRVLRGLLLHHLLSRINRSRHQPARARLRATLTSLAERVALDPDNGLSALPMAP